MDFSTFLASCGLAEQPCVLDVGALFERWRTVTDQRDPRGRRYPLAALLSIATLAKLAGQHTPQALTDWARLRTRELCRLLGLWRRTMPVLQTWERVFAQGIDPQELNRVVSSFLQETFLAEPPAEGWVVALDGKTLRGTLRRGTRAGVHLLALYLPGEGLVLAQMAVESKDNEISAAPQLLRQVALSGLIVTGDAMFAQRTLSLQIVAAGGDYVWDVKDNQPKLREAIATVFAPAPRTPGWGQPAEEVRRARTVEKGHGRLEERVLTASSLLQGYSDWPSLQQVFQLERTVTDLVSGQVSHFVRYGVTSLSAARADAARLLAIVRAHWGIESGLHYRRDVTFGEDAMHVRVGHAPHVHAILNNVLVGLLHQHGPANMAQGQREMTYVVDRLLAPLR